MAEPEKKSPAPVEVVNTEPLQVQIIAPEKDPLLLDLDIARAQPKPNVEPAVAPQVTTTTTTTNAPPPVMPPTVTKLEGVTLPPTTTEQEDIVVGRQAQIGRIWEFTQSILSVLITVAVIYAELTGVSSVTLGNAFFFVVSLYLIRTNHTKIGGIGPKTTDKYEGR